MIFKARAEGLLRSDVAWYRTRVNEFRQYYLFVIAW